MLFSTAIARPLQLITRTLQWASAVIVMGLTSFFISRGPHGQHILYQEVIVRCPTPSSMSGTNNPTQGRALRRLLPARIRFALPSNGPRQIRPPYRRRLLLPVCPSLCTTSDRDLLTRVLLPSWLTAFIFAAQDYSQSLCFFNSPPGITCGLKKANEAFIFLALYVSLY